MKHATMLPPPPAEIIVIQVPRLSSQVAISARRAEEIVPAHPNVRLGDTTRCPKRDA
jgi:hypothetical protein